MKYRVKANLLHDQLGKLREGQIIEPTKAQAGSIMEWLEEYKPEQIAPKLETDGEKQSALPAGQVSQPQTARPSGRGRPRKTGAQ